METLFWLIYKFETISIDFPHPHYFGFKCFNFALRSSSITDVSFQHGREPEITADFRFLKTISRSFVRSFSKPREFVSRVRLQLEVAAVVVVVGVVMAALGAFGVRFQL